jgi:NAD(P)-dependent dehydrogenase (short-subunit alcohol dehydrogenase family)
MAATGITTALLFGYRSILHIYDDDNGSSINDDGKDDDKAILPVVILSLSTIFMVTISVRTSIRMCKKTRQKDVVGITESQIPYYGPKALSGQIIVVTGANSGVGKETVRQCASMGATVVLLCRSKSKAQEAIDDILLNPVDSTATPSGSSKISKEQLIFIPMDLSHFDSIHRAVDDIRQLLSSSEGADKTEKKKKVNVLVNNAGLMMGTQTFSRYDNLEVMMQANHLGHYLLTRLLIDQQLLDTENGGRIINLTSSTYEFSSQGFDFDDIFCTRNRKYTLFGQYSMTKLANILMIKALHQRYSSTSSSSSDDSSPKNLLVYAVHPGIVRTNVTSNMQWYWQLPNTIFAVIVRTLQKTPSEGAYSTVFCAVCPPKQLPPNGSYIVNCRAHPTLDCANSPRDAERLWNISEELVGLAIKGSSSCSSSSMEEKKSN